MFFKIDKKAASLEIIHSFVKENYPDLCLLPAMLEQLLWLQDNSVSTSQSNVQVKKEDVNDVNIEVKRILVRLYCFELLMDGSLPAYSKFTQAQKNSVLLSEEHFKRLSCFIKDLSKASHESLLATCFITKSDEAIKNVPNEQKKELPVDSEQFISYMATNLPRVFPICSLITDEAVELLPSAFHQGSHARHMLDMEGGNNMFSSLKQAIGTRAMSYEQYNLWFARWIINIAGLDGHLNCNGSVYLTDPVARGIWALKSGLDQLWLDPNYPVIDDYLAFRQRELRVDNTYVAYLAALMRKHESIDGVAIQMWFDGLDSEVQREKIQAFNTQLTQLTVTPTFKPTVLVNLLDLQCSVSDALSLFTEIEAQAMQLYVNAIENGYISENTPLCYRSIAKDFLKSIKEFYKINHCVPKFTLANDGTLSVSADALKEEYRAKNLLNMS